jgi:hypothetical protein
VIAAAGVVAAADAGTVGAGPGFDDDGASMLPQPAIRQAAHADSIRSRPAVTT